MKRSASQDSICTVTPVKKSRKDRIRLLDQLANDSSDDSDPTLSNVKRDDPSETDTFSSSSSESSTTGDEDEKEAHRYAIHFFGMKGRPFNHSKEDRTFSLDPVTTNLDQFRIATNSVRDEEIVLLSRELQYFMNGTIVTKHCAPWGEEAVLCGRSFVIKTKIFDSNGTVSSIVITNQETPSVTYSLQPAFFVGWADNAIRHSYDSFMNV